MGNQKARGLSHLEQRFVFIAVLLSLFSFQALFWLCTERFNPVYVGAGGVCAGFAAWLLTRRIPIRGRSAASALGILAIAFLALLLRLNVSPYIFGGQDPGVYFNVGSYFAQAGTSVIKDDLLDELKEAPDLRAYYLAHSVRNLHRFPDGTWYGNLVSGIYLRNLDTNEWTSQFYFLNSMWLAIGHWLFGIEWQGLIIALFSVLTVIGAALVTLRLSGSGRAALLAAALMATNSTLAYFGSAPVSEGIAGFFFMSGLVCLTARCRYLSVLPFAALFLTRITGFITLPLLLVALLWILVKRGERSVIGVGLGYIASYGVSFFWGLKYSTYYATGIYEGKLGITGPMLGYAGTFFALLAVVWVVVGGVCIAVSNGRRILGKFVMRFGVRVTLVMLLFVALSALYRGYLLGFTDTFVGHRWLDTRWRMVGHGLESLEFLSLHTLAVMLSYGGAVAFLVGLVRVGKIGVRRASMGPVPILAAGFLGIFSVYPLATPYLYYFGRYLASELVPLGIICGAVAVDLAARRYHRLGDLIRWGYFVVIFCSLLPSFVTRLTLREGKDFFDLVSCIDRSTPGRSVILVEKRGLPETPLVTPLRLSYRKPPFSFRFVDFDTAEKRRRLVDFFTARGYKVFLLTGQKRWRSFEDVKFMGRLSGDFRTIGGKRGQPRRIRRRGVTVDLYSLTGEGTVSPHCAGVMR